MWVLHCCIEGVVIHVAIPFTRIQLKLLGHLCPIQCLHYLNNETKRLKPRTDEQVSLTSLPSGVYTSLPSRGRQVFLDKFCCSFARNVVAFCLRKS